MGMADLTHIANPLYDVVFRYLMEDNRVARLFLSAILDEEVIELTFNPTERSRKLGGEASLTVIRMDFHARIRQAEGQERVVLIELQKAKYHHQVMRFRSYLGKQYQNPEHINVAEQPLPLYPIYILGEAFTQAAIPVIRVERGYLDAATGRRIAEQHPFIEALTHDATVIQAYHLPGHRRTVLERFLSIFDQSGRRDPKGHILALDDADYPARYRPVIRRLQKALQNPDLEEEMDLEDEVMNEFHRKDQQIAAARQRAQEAEQQAKEARQTLVRTVMALSASMSVAQIALVTGLPEAEVAHILQREGE